MYTTKNQDRLLHFLYFLGIVRTANEIENEIGKLREKYHSVCDTLNGTGAGILESCGEDGLRDWTLKKCPHFYALEAVLGDRAGSDAYVTNESEEYGLCALFLLCRHDFCWSWRCEVWEDRAECRNAGMHVAMFNIRTLVHREQGHRVSLG